MPSHDVIDRARLSAIHAHHDVILFLSGNPPPLSNDDGDDKRWVERLQCMIWGLDAPEHIHWAASGHAHKDQPLVWHRHALQFISIIWQVRTYTSRPPSVSDQIP